MQLAGQTPASGFIPVSFRVMPGRRSDARVLQVPVGTKLFQLAREQTAIRPTHSIVLNGGHSLTESDDRPLHLTDLALGGAAVEFSVVERRTHG